MRLDGIEHALKDKCTHIAILDSDLNCITKVIKVEEGKRLTVNVGGVARYLGWFDNEMRLLVWNEFDHWPLPAGVSVSASPPEFTVRKL